MKCPVETIERFKKFTKDILNEQYKYNFVLTEGYYHFIEDLSVKACMLQEACARILHRRQVELGGE